MRKLVDSAIVLAVVTGYLYGAGTAKYNAYLSSLRVSPAVLERDAGQIIYEGMLTSLLPALNFALGLLIVSVFYTQMIFPLFLDIFEGNISRKRRLIKIRRIFFGKKKSNPRAVLAKKAARPYYILSGLFFAAIFLLASFERQGKADAREIIEKIKNENVPSELTMMVKGENGYLDLFYVGCGPELCAGIDIKTRMVRYVDTKSITLMTYASD